MALPKLSAQQPIVNPDRTPSSPFLQFMEKARSEQIATDERQDATDMALAAVNDRQDAADALLADAITDIATAIGLATDATNAVAGLADGTTPFTGLNVGGTNVKPFLDKTDGTALTDAAGLDDALVSTAKIADEAVTTVDVDFDAATVSVGSTAEVTLCSTSVTVLAGEKVDLQGVVDTFIIYGGSPVGDPAAQISIMLYRDSSLLLSRTGAIAVKQVVIGLSCPTSWTDEPAAGSYTYSLRVKTNTTSNLNTLDFRNAHLSATRIKR